MEIGNQILFFLAGLGVFNGLLLVCYFFFIVKPKRWVNMLFSLLMLTLCIRIGKSLFHIFMDLDRIYLQIGLSACIMIGPFLFLYLQIFLSKAKAPKKSDWIHIFVPLLGIIVVGVIWPYETHPDVWNNYVVKIIYGIWVLYTIAAFRIVAPLVKKAFKQKPIIEEYWMLLVYSCALALCVAYNLALYGFPYLAGPLLFSVVLYVLMAFLFSKKNRSIVLEEEPVKYQNQKMSEAKADAILNRLSDMMDTQQPYLNHKIKLAHIAQSIDSKPHEVSQVINDRLGLSFNHYINQYRIKAACVMLKENDLLTLEGIGQEVGFQSRTTFYTAFKSIINQTPGEYKAEVRQSRR